MVYEDFYYNNRDSKIGNKTQVFDADRHCGALSKQTGNPCKLPKGYKTDHYGEGRCKYHGGKSKGAKTKEGKKVVATNAIKGDLYGKRLRGKDKQRFEELQNQDTGSLFQQNFLYIQAKILGIIEGDVKLSAFFEKIVSVAEVLVEQEEATEDQVILLKQLLANVDLEKITRIMVSSSTLARTATQFSEEGDQAAENKLLRSYLIKSVQCGNIEVKQLASQYLILLQKDAGIPVDTIKDLVAQTQEMLEEGQLENLEENEPSEDKILMATVQNLEEEQTPES